MYVPTPPLPVVPEEPKARMDVPAATLVPVMSIPSRMVPVMTTDTVSNPVLLISPLKETGFISGNPIFITIPSEYFAFCVLLLGLYVFEILS